MALAQLILQWFLPCQQIEVRKAVCIDILMKVSPPISRLTVLFASVCLAVSSANSLAITYDEKLDPKDLVELAKRKEFESACQVNGASGVLVAPKVVLTARHVISKKMAKNWVKLDGKKREIEKVKVHPDVDLAVIFLKEAVKDREPTPIYRGADEVGMIVWKVGFGLWAPLVKGHREMLKRTNIAKAMTNNVFEATENELHYRYESKGPGHTEFEGGTAPGDSGGPLYAQVDGKWVVIGVTTGPRKGFYADCRLSTKAAWIDETIEGGE